MSLMMVVLESITSSIFPAMWVGVEISCSRLSSKRKSQKSVDCGVEPDIVPQLMLGRLKSPSRIRSSLRLFVLMRLCSREKYDWSALGDTIHQE